MGLSAAAPKAGPPVSTEAYANLHLRRNFLLIVSEAGLFFLGLAFFDGSTVLPSLLRNLGASDTLIGFTRLVQVLGFTLPALWAAHAIHGRRRHLPFLIKGCWLARSGLFLLPFAILMLAQSHPTLLLALFFWVYAQFWFVDGACAISWYDITAKAIPARVRGRLFGTMQTLGGVAAVAGAAGVSWALSRGGPGFPANYALLAGVWGAGALGSLVLLMLLHEPEGEVDEGPKPSLWEYVRSTIPMVRSNPALRRVIVARLVLEGSGMAAPFYALYAQDSLGAAAALLGVYVGAKSLGKIGTGPLWGWIVDRFGPMVGFRLVSVCVALVPAAALLAGLTGNPMAMVAPFLLMGSVEDGLWMTSNTVVMANTSDSDRPLAVGAFAVALAPTAAYGPVGGALAQAFGYRVAFGAALAFAFAGCLIALTAKSSSAARSGA
ncbi:MAG: MFS transporter [Armatimonadetes bacterium]|nr:MFS transporter [Armatimonadota bacterium]